MQTVRAASRRREDSRADFVEKGHVSLDARQLQGKGFLGKEGILGFYREIEQISICIYREKDLL